MLTSGMVPALYADDEKETLVGQVKVSFKAIQKQLVITNVMIVCD